ncbi:MAG: glycoside hydrolase family 2 [Psychrilyobacter sp.]|nr:glycoside hydrolase family 2 [Psychrilyobacter sp.]
MFRKEYPRPNFIRKNWLNLNGKWNFSFDDKKVGLSEKWFNKKELEREIEVPFCHQSELSGIEETRFHDVVWYQREIEIPKEWKDQRIKLNFGAVDYKCKIYVNGDLVGEHIGGHVNFSVDITDSLQGNKENIVVYVEDPGKDEFIPRGKQFWLEDSDLIWYTRTTGIWQTVWLEPVSKTSIDYIRLTPDLDTGHVNLETKIIGIKQDLTCQVIISFKGEEIVNDCIKVKNEILERKFDVFEKKVFRTNSHSGGWCWSPEHPNLFDVQIILLENKKELDHVDTYFGMRKVHIENGTFFLNNKPYYQKLVLDQGYWPKGLLTAPSDEDFVLDIKLSKEMGFNGCRKHQKVEDPRFLHHANKMGFIVWGEMANAAEYNHESVERLTTEWSEIVKRDYNNPSILAWVPLNESWGVPRIKFSKQEQAHSMAMYYLTKSLDQTRLVISNDGWELTKTDICGIHNYNHGNGSEKNKYEYYKETLKTRENILASRPAGKNVYADGYEHDNNTPIMLTEFGGIAFDKNHPAGWGYSSANTSEEFVADYKRTIDAVYNSDIINGYCYTQLTDVEQEVNGLLTYDRQPKCDLKLIEEINGKNLFEKVVKF